eukprot:scaffold11223_cov57-Attheya_sp.AAC.8
MPIGWLLVTQSVPPRSYSENGRQTDGIVMIGKKMKLRKEMIGKKMMPRKKMKLSYESGKEMEEEVGCEKQCATTNAEKFLLLVIASV